MFDFASRVRRSTWALLQGHMHFGVALLASCWYRATTLFKHVHCEWCVFVWKIQEVGLFIWLLCSALFHLLFIRLINPRFGSRSDRFSIRCSSEYLGFTARSNAPGCYCDFSSTQLFSNCMYHTFLVLCSIPFCIGTHGLRLQQVHGKMVKHFVFRLAAPRSGWKASLLYLGVLH